MVIYYQSLIECIGKLKYDLNVSVTETWHCVYVS